MKNLFDSPVKSAMFITSLVIIVVVSITIFWNEISTTILPNTSIGLYNKVFWEGVLVEAHGVIIELLILAVLIIWLDSRRGIKQEIKRIMEDLQDYAPLDFPEINIKKIGHLKRLNEYGISKINVQQLVIKNLPIRNIKFEGSNLIGLILMGSKVGATSFTNTQMRSSLFIDAQIKNTVFDKCTLTKSKFIDANCTGIHFKECNLERADFSNCNLQSANFEGSDLRGTRFNGANLNRSTLKGVINLDVEELVKAETLDYISVQDNILEQLKVLRTDMKYQGQRSSGA